MSLSYYCLILRAGIGVQKVDMMIVIINSNAFLFLFESMIGHNPFSDDVEGKD